MNLLLARLINHYKISPDWMITLVGIGLFVWSIWIDYQSLIDFINGIMPYPNKWQSYLFYTACFSYTMALIFTLFLRYFSVWIWLVYTLCLIYVVRHLPMDLITPPDWKTKHQYAFIDACYIVHGYYFFSKGVGCTISFLIPYYESVKNWIYKTLLSN